MLNFFAFVKIGQLEIKVNELKENFKRAEESARALEECLKLINTAEAEKFKQIRYALYDVEKSFFEKLPTA